MPLRAEQSMNDEEYSRRLVQLHAEAAAALTAGETPQDVQRQLRRAEFDLMVDCRLGPNLAAEKREALWQGREAMERERAEIASLWHRGLLNPFALVKAIRRSFGFLVKRSSRILSATEMQALLGEAPELPIDPVNVPKREPQNPASQ